MAAHARLKNAFTEDRKCHNLVTWLFFFFFFFFCQVFTVPKEKQESATWVLVGIILGLGVVNTIVRLTLVSKREHIFKRTL